MGTLTQEQRSQILATTSICPKCHAVNNTATNQVAELQGTSTSKIRWILCYHCEETYDLVERKEDFVLESEKG